MDATFTRCSETHNPGVWPYVSRCTRAADHEAPHRDRYLNEWEDEPREANGE